MPDEFVTQCINKGYLLTYLRLTFADAIGIAIGGNTRDWHLAPLFNVNTNNFCLTLSTDACN